MDSADDNSDHKHHHKRNKTAITVFHHPEADRTDQTYCRTAGKIGISSCQDTDKHAGCQNKDIHVLLEQVKNIAGIEKLAFTHYPEEDCNQYE